MLELFNEGKPVDLITTKQVKGNGCSATVKQFGYIDLVSVPTSANECMHRLSKKRQFLEGLLRLQEETANDYYLDKEKLDVILEKTEKQVFDIVQNREQRNLPILKMLYCVP